MAATLTIRDETPGSGTVHELNVEFLTETISVRELIRARVYQEVQDYNLASNTGRVFAGLVRPRPDEVVLNASREPKARRTIDWSEQFEVALDAFEHNRILILIDDRQAESLDETFTIRPDTTVSFLRLTPLVGG